MTDKAAIVRLDHTEWRDAMAVGDMHRSPRAEIRCYQGTLAAVGLSEVVASVWV